MLHISCFGNLFEKLFLFFFFRCSCDCWRVCSYGIRKTSFRIRSIPISCFVYFGHFAREKAVFVQRKYPGKLWDFFLAYHWVNVDNSPIYGIRSTSSRIIVSSLCSFVSLDSLVISTIFMQGNSQEACFDIYVFYFALQFGEHVETSYPRTWIVHFLKNDFPISRRWPSWDV